jgi:tetratricopeptide (TPR) repeat protein
MRLRIIGFCFLCLHSHLSFSQNLDSLQGVLSGPAWGKMNHDQKARVHELIGLYYARNSARATGLEWIGKAICEAEDSSILARCYRIKAQLLAFEERFEETKSAVFMGNQYRTKHDPVKEDILASNVMGIACTFTGLYDKAFEYYYRTLELAEKVNDNEGIFLVTLNLGLNYYKISDYEMAIKYFERSKLLCADPDDFEIVHSNLALAYSYARLPDKAMEILQQTMTSSCQTSSAQFTHVYYAQGVALEKLGWPDSAENAYMKSLNVARAYNNYRMLAENGVSLANIYLRTGRYAMADSCLRISEAFAESYDLQDILVKVFRAQADCSKVRQDLRSLLTAQQNLIDKNEQLYNAALTKTLGIQKSRFLEKDYQVAMHLHSQVLQQNRLLAVDHQIFTYVVILLAILLIVMSVLIIASIHMRKGHKTRLEGMIRVRLEKAISSVFQMRTIVKRDSEIICRLNEVLRHAHNIL